MEIPKKSKANFIQNMVNMKTLCYTQQKNDEEIYETTFR